MHKELISVVIPVLNEEENVSRLSARIVQTLASEKVDYEIIFVDDGSNDATVPLIFGLRQKNPRVKLLQLSRNFGHQAAITAGIDHAKGDAIITIDADLQDPPEIMKDMIAEFRSGCQIVHAVRSERAGEKRWRLFVIKQFYKMLNYISNLQAPVQNTGDYRLIGREVADILRQMKERNRYLRGLSTWTGFQQGTVFYRREARFGGTSKYPLPKLIKLALDGVTSFSNFPLKLASYTGFSLATIGFIYIIFIIIRRLLGIGEATRGWLSLMAMMLFINGIILIFIGIQNQYIARIYDEVRGRPIYVVKNKVL